MSILQKYNRPWTFYILSLVLPAVFFFACAYLSKQEQTQAVKIWENIVAFVGVSIPALVAYFLIRKDREVLADAKKRFTSFDGRFWKYFLLCILLTFGSISLAQVISVFTLGHSWDQFIITGQPSFSSFLFSTWFVIIYAAIVEEFAWHSYGTDSLRRKFSLFWTTVVFAVYWVAWHIPLTFIDGYYHSEVVAEGALYSLNFAVSALVFVFILNWLYYKSGRLIWIAVFFHVFANVGNEIFSTHPDSKVIQTGIFLVLVAILLVKERKMFFSKEWSEAK